MTERAAAWDLARKRGKARDEYADRGGGKKPPLEQFFLSTHRCIHLRDRENEIFSLATSREKMAGNRFAMSRMGYRRHHRGFLVLAGFPAEAYSAPTVCTRSRKHRLRPFEQFGRSRLCFQTRSLADRAFDRSCR